MRLAAVGLVATAGALAAVQINGNAISTSPAASSHVITAVDGTIPVTAKLVAIPDFPGTDDHSVSATVTDQAEISRVAQVLNALPAVPPGAYNCPMDTGAELELDFESAGGTALAQVTMSVTGCGFASVTVDGEKQTSRWGGRETVAKIKSILGTHWQLTPKLP